MTAADRDRRFDLLMNVDLDVTAEIGTARMDIARILELGTGSIVEFQKSVDEPFELRVNGKIVARGELIAVDERLGLRITQLVERLT